MDIHDFKNMQVLNKLSLVLPNDTVVDVGACRGIYVRYFHTRLGNTGKIYAVELSKANIDHMMLHCKNMSNIEWINAAASDKDGHDECFKGVTDQTYTLVGHDTSFNDLESMGNTKTVRLDTMLKDEESIKLVKIDVEGAEYDVLRGMKNVIHKVENILLETHFDEDWFAIRDLLITEYGFFLYDIQNERAVDWESPRPYQCLCTKGYQVVRQK